jgi:type VI secretion system protein ImpA
MPLPDNLLNPIVGANPGGQNLRYAPVYDKIKEARREEEDLPQGDWEHEVKASDPVLVTKLAVEALTKQSKDVQIAAWLVEASLRRESYPGLKEGLDFLKSLLETFWENLYPEIEDGDLELRAAPLDWIGNYFPNLIYRQPLTQEGYDWYKLKECRAVPTEADAAENESKAATRAEKLSEGKLAPEVFDEDVQRTPKQFYKDRVEQIEAVLESLQALSECADSKFGNQAPSFGKLRTALEELHHLHRGFLKKKQEAEPDEAPAEAPAAEEAGTEEVAEGAEAGTARPARARKGTLAAEPADKDDAINRVMVAAKFWRAQEPANPAPYLMVRGMRWGELRASGSTPDQLLFEPPPTELRQQMKKLSLEGNWSEVLEATETAAAMPCGRAWLDVHRYTVKACENLGSEYAAVMVGVLSGLRALLADYPDLPSMTLMDDTPVANAETVAWIKESVGASAAPAPALDAAIPIPLATETPRSDGSGEPAPPDAYEIATKMVNEGRAEAAIELLAHEVSQERSGRTRFHRMIQLASLCMATAHERIAYPMLVELSEEIDRRKLEDWEPRPVIAQPLALLYRCLVRLESPDEEMKKKVYERVCRLDPVQAMACLK